MSEIKIDGATLVYGVGTSKRDAKQYVSIVRGSDVQGHIKIPSEIEGLPVKYIEGLAFSGCKGLTGVTIPDGVVWIGESAFTAAPDLNYVKIPTSVRGIGACAFSCCGGLWSVEIPEGVTWIGFSAFVMCYNLVRVTIPSTLESISRWAFADCCRLSSVRMSPGVRSIEGKAFSCCMGLTDITLPLGVTSIGEEAFSGCRALKRVTIPDSVTSIGKYAFSGCGNLKDVSCPRHLENKSLESAFVFCSPKMKITYRDGVGVVGQSELGLEGCAQGTGGDGMVRSARWWKRKMPVPEASDLADGIV